MAIQACFQKKSPPELVLARLAAPDSLPFHKLEKSRYMQHLFREQVSKIPPSRQGMRKMFESYAEKIKLEQKRWHKMVNAFFLSIYEWTSRKNK